MQRLSLDVGRHGLVEGGFHPSPALPHGAKGSKPDSGTGEQGGGQVLGVSQEMHCEERKKKREETLKLVERGF